MDSRFRLRLIELIVFILFSSSLIVPAFAEKSYHVIMTLESPEPESGAEFGNQIVFNEKLILVGERSATVDGHQYAGKAHIFDWDGNLKLSLQAPTPQTGGGFGLALLLSEEAIVVGEWAEVDGLNYAGLVHIYDLEGNLQRTIQSPDPHAGQDHFGNFGCNLAFNGGLLVVSEPLTTATGVVWAGKVHLFYLNGNLHTSLQSPDPRVGAYFGLCNVLYSSTASQNRIVVGEGDASVENIESAGRVLIFDTNGTYLESLQSPEPQIGGIFGTRIAVDEDILAISEVESSVDGYRYAGKVHVFDTDGGFLMTLLSPEPKDSGFFSYSIATSKDHIFVCEPCIEPYILHGHSGKSEGRVHVYDRGGDWVQTLQAPEPTVEDGFGHFVYSNGDFIAVSDASSVNGLDSAGKVYLYKLGEQVESQEPVVETRTETVEPEAEPRGGITGYPLLSIVLAIVLYSLLLHKRSTSLNIG